MAIRRSAGILLFRGGGGTRRFEVFLIHPGGPFWAKKDDGAWSIPKGEPEEGEDALAAARREFGEETGHAPGGDAIPLGSVRQTGGKVVDAWAMRGDLDPARIHSNTFSMEWPPRSGRHAEFPEVDRAGWFSLEEARKKILKGQAELLDRFEAHMSRRSAGGGGGA